MRKIILLTLLTGISVQFSVSLAQGAYDTPYLNRAVLRFFSGTELTDLESNSPDKFDKLKYYFTQSFTVELNNCPGCIVDYDQFFNQELFNIVQFEDLRKVQNTYSFPFKENKYQITLLSQEDINAVIGPINTTSVLTYLQYREFPQWIMTGDDVADYENYKIELEKWASDFPEEYRALTSSTDLLKIHFGDFVSLVDERKHKVFTHPGGYMIIE
jgi:hypothetical protein